MLLLAARTKTLGLIGESADKAGLELPPEIAAQLAANHKQLLMVNLYNLEWTIKVAGVLRSESLDFLVLKGPIQSNRVYQRWDISKSCDVDVLVRPEQFDAAGKALNASGFLSLLAETDTWWSDHLGESPFQKTGTSSPVVDLHHQVQQPGGPFPRFPERFFSDSVTQRFSEFDVPVLSKEHAVLLTAISYGKAIREGAPWLHYAHELKTVHDAMSMAERAALGQLAVHHRLDRLYADVLSAAHCLFGLGCGEGETVGEMRRRQMIMSSCGLNHNPSLFRSRKLWGWTDGAPPQRLAEFARGMIRVARSEIARKSQEKKQQG